MRERLSTSSSTAILCKLLTSSFFILHHILLLQTTLHYRNCKDVVGDDHEQGKNDVCLDYLGGWERSCNSYYDCWNSRLKGECEDCASGNGFGCFNKYDSCKATCMASPDVCEAECDVCFCESDPNLAIEKCQAIGDDCCNDPYGKLIFLPLLPFLPACTFP